MHTCTHTNVHGLGKHGSQPQSSQVPAASSSESSAGAYSFIYSQDGFAIYIFNHCVRVWELIEITGLKLPGSNC